MMSTFFISLAFIAGFPEHHCADSVYRYPLADYTGSAEVVQGGTNGDDGLGSVSAYTPHPSLPYSSLYFHGTTSSFVELRVGTQFTLSSDWSFTMFVFSKAPHRGTIFDFVFDGQSAQAGQLWSNKIKLELNDSQIVFTMHGPNGQDYGSAVLGTIFTTEQWIPLSVVHDMSNGEVKIMTLNNEFYKSKDFQDNTKNIQLPQPAKVKLGGAYDNSNPFEGSIVCFALYDKKVSKGSLDDTLDECDPSNWPTFPTSIALPSTTTPTLSTTTVTTTTTTATTTAPITTTSTTSQVPTTTTTATTTQVPTTTTTATTTTPTTTTSTTTQVPTTATTATTTAPTTTTSTTATAPTTTTSTTTQVPTTTTTATTTTPTSSTTTVTTTTTTAATTAPTTTTSTTTQVPTTTATATTTHIPTTTTTATTTHVPTTTTTATTTAPTTTTSTSTMPPTTTQPTTCPEHFGFFIAIAKNKRPFITSTLASAIRKSSKQCAQLCLVEQGCLSFTYTHLTALCVLFDQMYNINLEINVGTHYYKRRDLC